MTWGAPVVAAAKPAYGHAIDQPWFSADPSNPRRLYITYTSYDQWFVTTGNCAGTFRSAIELVQSTDGGSTWSNPVTVQEVCYGQNSSYFVGGSNVAIGPHGEIYVVYTNVTDSETNPSQEIHIRASLDHGKSFGNERLIAAGVLPGGYFAAAAGNYLQGNFSSSVLPQVAVDRSNGPSHGTVYVTWSDGQNNIAPDLVSNSYAFSDIYVSKSANEGKSFTTPQLVSPTPSDFTGLGRDQFLPAIAVDKNGHVGVCYYDRRQNPANTAVDRYCSVSTDHAASWTEQQVSISHWPVQHANDWWTDPHSIGNYDTVTTDFLLEEDGFFGAFQVQDNGNPNIVAKSF